MKKLILLLLPAVIILTVYNFLVRAQVPPPTLLTLVSTDYILQSDQPKVEFYMDTSGSNELTFTSPTNLTFGASAQDSLMFVGCTNIVSYSFYAHSNVIYQIMVQTNGSFWTYTKMRVMSYEGLFSFFSIVDPLRNFTVLPSYNNP